MERYQLPVSIDLETASLSPDAPILSIGAVRFSYDSNFKPTEADEFYAAVDLRGQTAIDPDTFYWWLQQDDAARAAVLDGMGGLSLSSALKDLWLWLQAGEMPVGRKSHFSGELWIRGDRDSVWLEAAHKREGLDVPYDFRKVRDQRTLVKFAEDFGVVFPDRYTAMHDALADAKYQAECIQLAYRGAHVFGGV